MEEQLHVLVVEVEDPSSVVVHRPLEAELVPHHLSVEVEARCSVKVGVVARYFWMEEQGEQHFLEEATLVGQVSAGWATVEGYSAVVAAVAVAVVVQKSLEVAL